MRIKGIIIVIILTFFVTLDINYGQENHSADSTKKPASSSKLDQEKVKLEISKLKEEAEKIKAEIAKLKLESEMFLRAPDKGWRWLTIWITALGSIILAIIGLILNRTLKHAQHNKIKQEERLSEEKQILEVFKELGSNEARIRVGAAAILIQRLKKIREENEPWDVQYKYEFPTIMRVLITETKHEEKEEIQKYIADGIADALRAIVPENETPKKAVSPLQPYDFQGTKLQNAWWKRIDARGVDFYGASLVRAGLREAFLNNAKLKNANLTMTTLENAVLEDADLQGATLAYTKLANANLQNANLSDVDLTTSTLNGANFENATFNKETKLRHSQLTEAKFDDDVSTVVTLVD